MTILERDSLNLFQEILHYFSVEHISRLDFRVLVGKIRDMGRRLENASYHCPSGWHRGICTCRIVRGQSIQQRKKAA